MKRLFLPTRRIDQHTCSRRDLISSLSLGGVALAASMSRDAFAAAGTAPAAHPTNPAGGKAVRPSDASAGPHGIVPLPFAPRSLKGISERMITSHHDNNYAGAVKNLERVERELSHTTSDTPPFVVAALRERELTFRNSKSLHEAYFANLGGNGRRSGAIEATLVEGFGTAARWEEQFRITALGLGGGSGWVLLNYELDTGHLRTTAATSHTQALVLGLPLLVLDLYEHSYQMDYGANVARYIDAFFVNLNWDEVNRRLEIAQRAWATLRPAASRE